MAVQHGFKKAIGVEVFPVLCVIARKNIATYRKRHPGSCIDVHCANAATFEVPVEVNIVFLYNPFGSEVILAVIDRIAESIALSFREFYVAYLHPRFEDLFVSAGFSVVYRQGADGLVLIRRR
jgi:hypothetical protein